MLEVVEHVVVGRVDHRKTGPGKGLGRTFQCLLVGARVGVADEEQVGDFDGALVIVTSRNRLAGPVAVDGAHPFHLHILPTPEARALLALHPGPDTSLPTAASLAGLTRPHTRQLLSELVQADLGDETVPGRYASHDLLRAHATELTESIDPPQQVRAARYRMFDHCLHTAREAVAPTDSGRAPAFR